MTTFQALYDNEKGLQDKFVSYWDHTSKRFSNNKYVVGYDPLNEPLAGNMMKNLINNYPGSVDRYHLAPMYERIFKAY